MSIVDTNARKNLEKEVLALLKKAHEWLRTERRRVGNKLEELSSRYKAAIAAAFKLGLERGKDFMRKHLISVDDLRKWLHDEEVFAHFQRFGLGPLFT